MGYYRILITCHRKQCIFKLSRPFRCFKNESIYDLRAYGKFQAQVYSSTKTRTNNAKVKFFNRAAPRKIVQLMKKDIWHLFYSENINSLKVNGNTKKACIFTTRPGVSLSYKRCLCYQWQCILQPRTAAA